MEDVHVIDVHGAFLCGGKSGVIAKGYDPVSLDYSPTCKQCKEQLSKGVIAYARRKPHRLIVHMEMTHGHGSERLCMGRGTCGVWTTDRGRVTCPHCLEIMKPADSPDIVLPSGPPLG